MASSIFQQLSSLCFLGSAFFTDLLVMRIFLTMANGLLVLIGFLGHPNWPVALHVVPWTSAAISWDTVCWGTCNTFINLMSLLRIFYDERRITLDPDNELLWNFLFRHSGMSKAQFKAILSPHLTIVEFKKGQTIPVKDKFYIILDGVISAKVSSLSIQKGSQTVENISMVSGEMFPLQFMSPFMSHENVFLNTWIEPTVEVDAKLFCLPALYLRTLAMNPKGRDVAMAMLVTSMAVIAERPAYKKLGNELIGKSAANQEELHPEYFDLQKHRSHLFDPLVSWEIPDPLLAGSGEGRSHPFAHAWLYMKSSFQHPWPFDSNFPTGLRHQLLPPIDPKKIKAMDDHPVLKPQSAQMDAYNKLQPEEYQAQDEENHQDVNDDAQNNNRQWNTVSGTVQAHSESTMPPVKENKSASPSPKTKQANHITVDHTEQANHNITTVEYSGKVQTAGYGILDCPTKDE